MTRKKAGAVLEEDEEIEIIESTEKPSTDNKSFPHGLEETEVVITESPFHKNLKGQKVKIGVSVANKMIANGWAEAVSVFLILLLSLIAIAPMNAQTSVLTDLRNSLGTASVPILSDTVTNTGTGTLSSIRVNGPGDNVTIVVTCTEISGTTAGTITIQGSLDGTNYKAIPTNETQTSITTATALDVASQVFTWRLASSPYLYYRVSWTGSGTMAASFAAKLMKH